jgi:hypothetical protein
MLLSIVESLLLIVFKIIAATNKNKEQQAEYQKRIKDAINKWNNRVDNGAKTRKEYEDLNTKIDDEWQKKFGDKKP